MCPITLTTITTTMIAFANAMAAGSGIAAAGAAGAAAGGAAISGAGFSAALAAGAGASGVTISGAAAAGTAAAVAAPTAASAASAGTAATAGLTATTVLGEVAALASLATSLQQHSAGKKRAKDARKIFKANARVERNQAADEAVRAGAAEAEEAAATTIERAQSQGVIHNLQNRSDVQIAALTREIEREAQTHDAAVATRLEAISGDVRSAYKVIEANANAARRGARDPSGLALALNIGSNAVSSYLNAA